MNTPHVCYIDISISFRINEPKTLSFFFLWQKVRFLVKIFFTWPGWRGGASREDQNTYATVSNSRLVHRLGLCSEVKMREGWQVCSRLFPSMKTADQPIYMWIGNDWQLRRWFWTLWYGLITWKPRPFPSSYIQLNTGMFWGQHAK